jgi:uncharacterized protein
MNHYYRRIALAWLVSVGVGCTSAPVRYYTLSPPPDKSLPVPATTPAIDVRVVHIPPQLERSELIVRMGSSEVTLLENERWASPVNDEIQEAVRLDLQRRLGHMTGPHAAFTKLTLDIDVRQLEAEFARYALFEASWRATLSATGRRSTGVQTANCTFRAEERIDTGYAGMVEGYQRAIGALADSIVSVLTSPSGNIEASCRKLIEGSTDGSDS